MIRAFPYKMPLILYPISSTLAPCVCVSFLFPHFLPLFFFRFVRQHVCVSHTFRLAISQHTSIQTFFEYEFLRSLPYSCFLSYLALGLFINAQKHSSFVYVDYQCTSHKIHTVHFMSPMHSSRFHARCFSLDTGLVIIVSS